MGWEEAEPRTARVLSRRTTTGRAMAAPNNTQTPVPWFSSPGAFASALFLIRVPPLLPSATGTLKKGDIVWIPPVHSSPRVAAPPPLSGLCGCGGRAGAGVPPRSPPGPAEGLCGLPGRGARLPALPALCLLKHSQLRDCRLLLRFPGASSLAGGSPWGCSPPWTWPVAPA